MITFVDLFTLIVVSTPQRYYKCFVSPHFSRPNMHVFKEKSYICHRKTTNTKDYARDLPDHNPPHFHVRYNEYRAIIDIQTGKVTGQMPRRALHLVFEWLDLHKDELMENWERMENGETLAKINPLD